MRIGSIIFWTGFALFLAMPVIGYQYYLKSLRKQADAINMGKDQLGGSINNNLSDIAKHLDPKTAGQVPSGADAAGAKSKQLFEQMQKRQKSQLEKNPLLQKK